MRSGGPATVRVLGEKLAKALAAGRSLPRALALIRHGSGAWTALWVGALVVQGLLPVATVYLTREVVDGLVASRAAGSAAEALAPILPWLVLLAATLLAAELLRVAIAWIDAAQSERLQDHVMALIHERSAAADLGFYEQAGYHDHLHRAREEARHRPAALLRGIGSLGQSAITLVAMGVVLLQFGAWLPLALLVSTVPALWVALRFIVEKYEWERSRTVDQRRMYYYDWMLGDPGTAAELRLFDLGGHFREAYSTLRAVLRSERLDIVRRQSLAELSAALLGLGVTGGCLAWMFWNTLGGERTLGDLALFYQTFHYGQSMMRSLLGHVGQLYGNVLFLGNLFAFLDLEPVVVSPPDPRPAPSPIARGIRFRDVSFSYPGSERRALEGFDVEIPEGKTVAIVGPNGAGKSTILKLLCRLYDPVSGAVEIDGVDLRAMALDDLRRKITVLFQEPVHYAETAARNVALGDLSGAPTPDRIRDAARAAGADETIARLPDGYAQLLGKWLPGGADLSVGEWQRVALARAFLRPAPVILLDEPTSAMDSWAENEWHDRFRRLAQGRTVIVITHRFTTAMRADVIHVMESGRIVESGTHAELVASHGPYAASWTAQMRAGDVARF